MIYEYIKCSNTQVRSKNIMSNLLDYQKIKLEQFSNQVLM